jgi:hypothetical protein
MGWCVSLVVGLALVSIASTQEWSMHSTHFTDLASFNVIPYTFDLVSTATIMGHDILFIVWKSPAIAKYNMTTKSVVEWVPTATDVLGTLDCLASSKNRALLCVHRLTDHSLQLCIYSTDNLLHETVVTSIPNRKQGSPDIVIRVVFHEDNGYVITAINIFDLSPYGTIGDTIIFVANFTGSKVALQHKYYSNFISFAVQQHDNNIVVGMKLAGLPSLPNYIVVFNRNFDVVSNNTVTTPGLLLRNRDNLPSVMIDASIIIINQNNLIRIQLDTLEATSK